MGSMSPIHWVILAVIVLVLFGGGGKISSLMGDFAKGIKSFKKGMAEDESSAEGKEKDERLSPPQGGAAPSQQGQAAQPQDARMADDESHRSH